MTTISLHDYLVQINQLLDESRMAEAAAHCRHILETYPRHVGTYRALAQALLEQGEYEGAIDVFHRVLSAIPDDFISHLGLAIIYEEQADWSQSVWHMERAFDMKPYDATVQKKLRELYRQTNNPVSGRLTLTRGALVRLYIRGELYTQATLELQQAIRAENERIDLEVLLAESLWNDGQRVEAVNVCRRVLAKLPNCIQAHAILAEISSRAGHTAEAHKHLQLLQDLTQLDEAHCDVETLLGKAFVADGSKMLPARVEIEFLEDLSRVMPDAMRSTSWSSETYEEADRVEDDGTFSWLREDVFGPEAPQVGEGAEADEVGDSLAMESLWLVDQQEAMPDIDETAATADLPDWLEDLESREAVDSGFEMIEGLVVDAGETADLAASEGLPDPEQTVDSQDWADETLVDEMLVSGVQSDDVPEWLPDAIESDSETTDDDVVLESSWFSSSKAELPEDVEHEADEDADWLTMLGQVDSEQLEPETEDLVIDVLSSGGIEEAALEWLSEEDDEDEIASPVSESAPDATDMVSPAMESVAGEDRPDWLDTDLFDVLDEDELADVDMEAESADISMLGTDSLDDDGDAIPEWLTSDALAAQIETDTYDPAADEPVHLESDSSDEDDAIPDWLKSDAFDSQDTTATIESAVDEPDLAESDLTSADIPDWLLEDTSEEPTDEDTIESEAAPEVASEGLSQYEEDTPTWLQQEQFDTQEGIEVAESAFESLGLSTDMTLQEEAGIPAWLGDEAEDSEGDTFSEIGPEQSPRSVDTDRVSSQFEGLPAWLQDEPLETIETSRETPPEEPSSEVDSAAEAVDSPSDLPEVSMDGLESSDEELPTWLRDERFDTQAGIEIVEQAMDSMGLSTGMLSTDSVEIPEWLAGDDDEPETELTSHEKLDDIASTPSEADYQEDIPSWLADEQFDTRGGIDVVEQAMADLGLSTGALSQTEADLPDWLLGDIEDAEADDDQQPSADSADAIAETFSGAVRWSAGMDSEATGQLEETVIGDSDERDDDQEELAEQTPAEGDSGLTSDQKESLDEQPETPEGESESQLKPSDASEVIDTSLDVVRYPELEEAEAGEPELADLFSEMDALDSELKLEGESTAETEALSALEWLNEEPEPEEEDSAPISDDEGPETDETKAEDLDETIDWLEELAERDSEEAHVSEDSMAVAKDTPPVEEAEELDQALTWLDELASELPDDEESEAPVEMIEVTVDSEPGMPEITFATEEARTETDESALDQVDGVDGRAEDLDQMTTWQEEAAEYEEIVEHEISSEVVDPELALGPDAVTEAELEVDLAELEQIDEAIEDSEDSDDTMMWLGEVTEEDSVEETEREAEPDDAAFEAEPGVSETSLGSEEDLIGLEIEGKSAETPEDLDDAMAWLEELAEDESGEVPDFSAEIADIGLEESIEPESGIEESAEVPEDLDAAMTWLEGMAEEEPVEELATPAEVRESGDAADAERMSDSEAELLELELSEEAPEVPEDLDEAMTWLEGLAARQGAPTEELPSLAEVEEQPDVPETAQDDLEPPMAFEASVIQDDAIETVARDVEVADVPEDLDEAMAWLEELAAKQGAPIEELPTIANVVDPRDSELTSDEDEVAAEEEPTMAEGETDERSAVEDTGDLTDVPEDVDDAMGWLDTLAEVDEAAADELVGEIPEEVAEIPEPEPQIGEARDEEVSPEIIEEEPATAPAEVVQELDSVVELTDVDEALDEATAWLERLDEPEALEETLLEGPEAEPESLEEAARVSPTALDDALEWLERKAQEEGVALAGPGEDEISIEFDDDELEDALSWLDDLAVGDQPSPVEAEQTVTTLERGLDETVPATEVMESDFVADVDEAKTERDYESELLSVEPEEDVAFEEDLRAEPVATAEIVERPEQETIADEEKLRSETGPEEEESVDELSVQPTFGSDDDALFEPSVDLSEGVLEDGFLDDVPEDPDAALAWLEQFVEADAEVDSAEPAIDTETELVQEAVEGSSEPEVPGQSAVARMVSELYEEMGEELDGSLLERIPDDPDEAIAWLQHYSDEEIDAASEGVSDAARGKPSPEILEDLDLDETELEDDLLSGIPEDPDEAMEWLQDLADEQGIDQVDLSSIIASASDESTQETVEDLLDDILDEAADETEEQETAAETLSTLEVVDATGEKDAIEEAISGDLEESVSDDMPEWLTFEPGTEESADQTGFLRSVSDADISGWLEAEEATASGVFRFDSEITRAEDRITTGPLPEDTVPPEPEEETTYLPDTGRLSASAIDLDESQLTLARQTLNVGDYEEAANAYQSLVEAGEGLSTLIAELENVAEKHSGQPLLRRVLGDAYMRNGQLQRALDNYRTALDQM